MKLLISLFLLFLSCQANLFPDSPPTDLLVKDIQDDAFSIINGFTKGVIDTDIPNLEKCFGHSSEIGDRFQAAFMIMFNGDILGGLNSL